MPNKPATKFRFHTPVITISLAAIIAFVSYAYSALPLQLRSSNLLIWATSPFNLYYETANNGILYNFVLVIAAYLLIELYSRNLADLKGRDSLMDNAFYISIGAAYLTSLSVWLAFGVPSVGTSILGFTVLIFFAVEITDSELIERLGSLMPKARFIVPIALFVFAALMLSVFMLLFTYLNGNTYWYIHIIGGAIFAQGFFMYAMWLRSSVDKEEEMIKKDVEKIGKGVVVDIERLEERRSKNKKGKGETRPNPQLYSTVTSCFVAPFAFLMSILKVPFSYAAFAPFGFTSSGSCTTL